MKHRSFFNTGSHSSVRCSI